METAMKQITESEAANLVCPFTRSTDNARAAVDGVFPSLNNGCIGRACMLWQAEPGKGPEITYPLLSELERLRGDRWCFERVSVESLTILAREWAQQNLQVKDVNALEIRVHEPYKGDRDDVWHVTVINRSTPAEQKGTCGAAR
jgi:hypothetical protein